jgi:hypothetical protein
MKILATILVLCSLAGATTFTVKSSGGNYTVLGTCMNDSTNVHAGDTCQVFASASPQAGWTQSQSGSAGLPITATVNPGDSVTINSTVTVSSQSYITFSGFNFTASIIGNGSTQHIVIDSNILTGSHVWQINDGLGSGGSDNVFSNNTVNISTGTTASGVYVFGDRNRFENNTLSGGSSDCFEVGGANVVVRGNYCHDEDGTASGEHIDFVQVIGAGTTPTLSFSLMENNTVKNNKNQAHALIIRTGSGPVADTNIYRFNYIYQLNGGTGGNFGGIGDNVPNNKFYNNTVATEAKNAENGDCASWQNATGGTAINNICYNVTAGSSSWAPFYDFNVGGGGLSNNNGNLAFTTAYAGGWNSPYTGEATYAALHSQDPKFANYPTDDSLQASSPAKGAGVALTTVSSGCNSTSLVFTDSHFFQPGWAGTNADWVRVGASTTAQITGITYSTNTVTFGSSVSCTNGDSVYLYKDSNGNQKLFAASPDVGAFQIVPVVPAVQSGTLGNGAQILNGAQIK